MSPKKKVAPSGSLPKDFEDLDKFVPEWALGTERERNRKRLSCSYAQIQVFYNAMLPRLEAIMNYLNPFPLEAMPEDARRLFLLCLSLAEVTTAVERYGQPGVVDGFEPGRFIAVAIAHMTPPLEAEARKQEEPSTA